MLVNLIRPAPKQLSGFACSGFFRECLSRYEVRRQLKSGSVLSLILLFNMSSVGSRKVCWLLLSSFFANNADFRLTLNQAQHLSTSLSYSLLKREIFRVFEVRFRYNLLNCLLPCCDVAFFRSQRELVINGPHG